MPALLIVRPAWAMNLGVKVPCGSRFQEPLAKSKGAQSDQGSGGRKRQSPEPMYKKRI